MKILVVCSKNSGHIAPFIIEQVDALNRAGLVTDYFTVEQRGIRGYLKSRKGLMKTIKTFQPDVIHAHYGLSGLLANLQRKIPVVTTYHGSDINNSKAFRFSKWAIRLSKFNIFVSKKNIDKAGVKRHFALIPCGVNLQLFKPKDKTECRNLLNLDKGRKYVLFSSAFDNQVKNPELAKAATNKLKDVELLELKGYTREQVVVLMNAVDVCLMTSFIEGSPQFIKEAMACNCPIVSVDVGDVKSVIDATEGCFVADSPNISELADKLKEALAFNGKTNGRTRIEKLQLNNEIIAHRLMDIYRQIL